MKEQKSLLQNIQYAKQKEKEGGFQKPVHLAKPHFV
jgi:hypothetical protein